MYSTLGWAGAWTPPACMLPTQTHQSQVGEEARDLASVKLGHEPVVIGGMEARQGRHLVHTQGCWSEEHGTAGSREDKQRACSCMMCGSAALGHRRSGHMLWRLAQATPVQGHSVPA